MLVEVRRGAWEGTAPLVGSGLTDEPMDEAVPVLALDAWLV